ncbi:MAG TPA: phage terminase large subunit family protein, partial [Opitutaceae bacterium]|nr:phage terminase large subunit family protein [Opitutaceae bacterium]
MPGPRRPEVTPYGITFVRAIHDRMYRKVVLVISAQTGKTESLLDVIGERLDTSPVPILYVGPSEKAIREMIEPRIVELFDEAPSLRRKIARGKRMTKTRKVVSGVPLRLASAQSSSDLKSDRFGLALTDEADEVVANLNGQGDPIQLVDARGESYADFVHAIVSTPSTGPSEVDLDEESGLEFWAETDPEEVGSTIWKLWLAGTRHHWAWPCPHCGEYFIPRFRCLSWEKPKDEDGKELPSTPLLAKKTAHLICPVNGCIIEQEHQEEMNARGVYVAPGQWIDEDGNVQGLPPESLTISFWVSGLASPFKSWGDRAASYVEAVRSRNRNSI